MSSEQPNIIFIITDQQRYDTIGALGYDHVDTPHLDRLVKDGLHFTDCHVTAYQRHPQERRHLAAFLDRAAQ
jgi:arylsulfatase A-like enzyme